MQNDTAIKYYNVIKERVDSGQYRIISIIAPPRTNSTMLERAMIESPDIHGQINEPWSIDGSADREQLAYKKIYQRLDQLEKTSPELKTIVIKNIADYIPPGRHWKCWDALVSHHIFLLRNPFLNIPSLLKQLLPTISDEFPLSAHQTVDDFARDHNYTDWKACVRDTLDKKRYAPLEAVLKAFFPRCDAIHQKPVMQYAMLQAMDNTLARRCGYADLHEFANNKNISDWETFCSSFTETSTDFSQCKELLDECFLCRITGWEALQQHLRASTGAISIVDGTELRSHPKRILSCLCEALDISYSEDMIYWTNEQQRLFDHGYEDRESTPFYDRVLRSAQIGVPLEKPCLLDDLPEFLQHHITAPHGAFAIYYQMLGDSRCLGAVGSELSNLLSTQFDTQSLEEIDPIFAHAIRWARIPAFRKSLQEHPSKSTLYSDTITILKSLCYDLTSEKSKV